VVAEKNTLDRQIWWSKNNEGRKKPLTSLSIFDFKHLGRRMHNSKAFFNAKLDLFSPIFTSNKQNHIIYVLLLLLLLRQIWRK